MNRKERRAARSAPSGAAAQASIGDAAMQCFAKALREHQAGRAVQAVAAYRQAIALDPNRPEFHNNLGLMLQALNKLPDAAAAYRKAIALAPGMREAHFNLGLALAAMGRPADAAAAYRQALALMPEYAELHYNLANTLLALGDPDAAIDSYRRAIALKPAYPEAYTNLAATLRERGDLGAATAAFRRAAALDPGSAEACNNLGIALCGLGALEEAVAWHRRAIALRPDHAGAYTDLGIALHRLGQPHEAVAAYRKAIAVDPDHAGAHNNLGVVLQELEQLDEALAHYRRARALKPHEAEAVNNQGLLLQGLGRLDEAEAAYRQAVGERPDYCEAVANLAYLRRTLCDWRELDQETELCRGLVRAGARAFDPLAFIAMESTPAEQLQCARQWAAARTGGTAVLAPPPVAAKDRLRIGYLSADLRQHPVSVLTAELFERHDRGRFEIAAYSYGADDGSAMRRRLVAAFDRFVEIGPLPHAAAAERIRADGIDILVDLTGHTRGARLPILAARPAPVQVNFLGFPGTLGAPFIDYVIADPIVAPLSEQQFFDETIVHLPHTFMPSDTTRAIAATTPSRAACGLPETGFVFCCFNNSYKLAPAVFDVWMRLLRAVPGSVLWLSVGNTAARAHLAREAQARGVAPDRLVFAERMPEMADHLARHRLADLFLDTLPYNAHTTASDALWAGLPVLTCRGGSFAGRVSASLLHAAGLDALVAPDLASYEALALRLTREPAQLAAVRARLADNRSTAPLFDMARYVRTLEAAYRRMWEIRVAGGPPESFSVQEPA
jgi:predicted O-linked N-acetylglucosamine transferase (SPINDLY family)